MEGPKRRGRRSRGFIRFKTLVALLVLVGAGYVAAKLVPVYWNYLAMQDPVKEAAMAASRHGKEEEVRRELMARAQDVGIPLDEESVHIGQEGNMMVVRVAWEVPLDIPLYRRTLRFQIEKAAPAP
jgi:hypothetical protein